MSESFTQLGPGEYIELCSACEGRGGSLLGRFAVGQAAPVGYAATTCERCAGSGRLVFKARPFVPYGFKPTEESGQ